MEFTCVRRQVITGNILIRVETQGMEQIITSYREIFHFWEADKRDKIPLCVPL